jgi:hypothetical protein
LSAVFRDASGHILPPATAYTESGPPTRIAQSDWECTRLGEVQSLLSQLGGTDRVPVSTATVDGVWASYELPLASLSHSQQHTDTSPVGVYITHGTLLSVVVVASALSGSLTEHARGLLRVVEADALSPVRDAEYRNLSVPTSELRSFVAYQICLHFSRVEVHPHFQLLWCVAYICMCVFERCECTCI